MSKARLFMAATALTGVVGFGTVMIPAGAASADTTTSTTTTSSTTDPTLSVCLTVTPKTVSVDVNGDAIVLGPVAVSTTCVATPF